MQAKTISELSSKLSLSATDYFVIDDGQHNYKVPWSVIAGLIKMVAGFAADPDTENYPGYLKLTLSDGTELRAYAPDPAKQDKLVWDEEPTDGSGNAITSGAVAAAIAAVLESLPDVSDLEPFTGYGGTAPATAGLVPAPDSADAYLKGDGSWEDPDQAPTAGSTRLVTSGAVYAAIQAGGGGGGGSGGGSGETVVVDNELSSTSMNPVQNRVIANALALKQNAEQGKGLSANDYTADAKAVVDALAGLLTAENNGKVLAIQNGALAAVELSTLLEQWQGGSY